MLREVLQKLGTPIGTCKYSCHYRVGLNGLKDYFIVSVKILACKEVPELLPFTTCKVESTITKVIQYVSRSGL